MRSPGSKAQVQWEEFMRETPRGQRWAGEDKEKEREKEEEEKEKGEGGERRKNEEEK